MEQDKLNLSLSEIKAGRVLSAIGMAREYAQYNNTGHWRDEIEGISGDYELMLEYMERGMYDPERGKMYDRIRTRLELCVRNIMLDRKIKSSPFFPRLSPRHRVRCLSRNTSGVSLRDLSVNRP